ncbi:cohesin domain-containing protein [Paenibacillus sp. WQ 127069]|uniref:Cohesin domain-containing protein n=1 Tax=Paenibacillus baimaensis TaxID=2982185 RepID=A0ABT2UKH2_9BACL|nr:cohesin domain-containing protein [Paenibacillus sp. WQ 127069]MCU6795139.1 cohesin domain-containing protein [Paenibacillus sp. WQ 127069]
MKKIWFMFVLVFFAFQGSVFAADIDTATLVNNTAGSGTTVLNIRDGDLETFSVIGVPAPTYRYITITFPSPIDIDSAFMKFGNSNNPTNLIMTMYNAAGAGISGGSQDPMFTQNVAGNKSEQKTFPKIVGVKRIDLYNYSGVPANIYEVKINNAKVPIDPSNFQLVSKTFESAVVSWTNPTDVDLTTVKIYNPGLVHTSTESSFVGVSGRTATINGLAADTNYTFRITALNSFGESIGKTLSFKTDPLPDTTPPNAPNGLSAVPADGNVILNWTISTEVTSYNVKRSTTAGGPYTTIASSVAGSSYNDSAVTNGTTYYYVVTAINAYGESSNSNEVSTTPQAPLPPAPTAPALSGLAGNLQNILTWTASLGATSYDVKRSTTPTGPYTTITSSVYSNVYSTYTDTSVVNGTTYYYVVSASNAGGSSVNSNEVSLKPQAPLEPALNIVIAEEKVKVGQEFTANVELKDVTNIYAEDFTVKYDNTKFDYLGFEAVTGFQIYNQSTDQNGTLRFIIASQGVNYGITGEKTFVKLKLRAKAVGVGKVDALKCRIADIDHEFDLGDPSCGEDTVTVENQDVNRNGEYTLLDLAIDGYYYGQLASNANPAIYTADQAGDEYVNNDDLIFIVKQMLLNTNYAPNL